MSTFDLYDRGQRVRKTTPEQRQEMRDAYRAGQTRAQIATNYDISPGAVAYHTRCIDQSERVHVPANRSGIAPCGTNAAYQRHKQLGEPVCDACRQARSEAMHAYYLARKERMA